MNNQFFSQRGGTDRILDKVLVDLDATVIEVDA